jgi:hypothetical protein
MGSTSTLPCAASTRLPAAAALRQLRRASECLGTSRGSSRGSSHLSSSTTPPRAGSSSTTSPPPHVWVPRHVVWLITQLVAPLVVDYAASCRLVVDYFASATCLGASARHAARHAVRRAARRRLLRLAQARRRLLRLRRASGCLGTSRGSSHGSSSTTLCAATSSCGHTGSTSATPCVVTTCLAATLALHQLRRALPQRRLLVASLDHSSRLVFQTSRERQSRPQQLVRINSD